MTDLRVEMITEISSQVLPTLLEAKILFYTQDRYIVCIYFISKIIESTEELKPNCKRPCNDNQGGILVSTTNFITKLMSRQKEKKKPQKKKRRLF